MKILCTYCSASKDPDKGLIPAFRRYISPRIIFVQDLAEKEDAHFCILSGEFGLVDWDQPLPWYDHILLREEIDRLAEIVTNQIQNKKISEIDYYTRSPKIDMNVTPYLNVIEKASQMTATELSIFTLEEPKISATIRNWKLIMEMAAEARQKMILDRNVGENEFIKLLSVFPDDGMIYFQRAGGYEMLGELNMAKRDFEIAKSLFPLDRWQWQAQEAINRINRHLFSGGTVLEAKNRLKILERIDKAFIFNISAIISRTEKNPISTAIELRGSLEYLIKRFLEEKRIQSSNLDKDIEAIKSLSIAPDIVINHMHTVRIIGNRAAHHEPGQSPLKPTDVYPSITALLAILEWENGNFE